MIQTPVQVCPLTVAEIAATSDPKLDPTIVTKPPCVGTADIEDMVGTANIELALPSVVDSPQQRASVNSANRSPPIVRKIGQKRLWHFPGLLVQQSPSRKVFRQSLLPAQLETGPAPAPLGPRTDITYLQMKR